LEEDEGLGVFDFLRQHIQVFELKKSLPDLLFHIPFSFSVYHI
jgi:hypothetical protein